MRLSVLMPARNAAKTIRASLGSTLRALPKDAEVLVLDDASSDHTAAIASEMEDGRVKVLRSPTPSGVAGALNVLLADARGEFVARMDADDIVLPGRFKSQLSRFNRRFDLIFGGVLHFGERVKVPYPSPPLTIGPDAFPSALLIDNPVAHSTMMARRDLLLEIGGYRECLAEDYDLWLRAAARGARISRFAAPVTALRRHAGQVTADKGWAERASNEPEWQESYAALAEATGQVAGDTELLAEVNAAMTIGEKRTLLLPGIMRTMKDFSARDALALKILMRRG
ncbi:Glycosyltransferase involved in cell wall biosynthesis [Arthrobacter sp. 9V]|jgi:glycosyltransferase involved in cell wall biosynthesis|nr:glycosyltransferase family A protein [Curtobacterium sp. MEB011]VXB48436.1 Polypeptide N-acetylgalactosaminyltransferase [Curtobacterium sp. 8I-2]VXB68929.1 Glycosyltransferase involved in cell wall biosynthesis [Arthrobacter sp. 9V]